MASRFSFNDAAADTALIDSLSGKELYEAAAAARRLQCQAEARVVTIARRIYDESATLVTDPGDIINADDWDKAGIGEVSAAMRCSKSQAGKLVSLGMGLCDVPLVREAFLNGEFGRLRAQVIVDALCAVDIGIREQIEPLALALAGRDTIDRTLRHQLSELIILTDPDAAAKERDEFGARHQYVRVRDEVHGHAALDAILPAEVGVHIAARIKTLICQRVCKNDPPALGQQRATALAELVGTPGVRLTCECGGCEWATDEAGADGLVDVDEVIGESAATVDTPLAAEPAEAEDLPADPADTRNNHPEPPMPPGAVILLDPEHEQVPWMKDYGPVDPEHASKILGKNQATPDVAKDRPPALFPGLILSDREPPPTLDLSQLANPSLAPPVDPTGHGGILTPDKSMLTYAPSRALRKQIFHSDRTCRYPFCSKPSYECDLDHVVPFTHANPEQGGWTTSFNIAPLCPGDHDRKHFGIWIPTMRTDRSISWHNPAIGQTLITYPR